MSKSDFSTTFSLKPINRRFIDVTGKRFDRLIVTAYAGSDSRRSTYWHCLCDCGNKTVVTSANLRRHHTRSCGCLAKDLLVTRLATHGLRHRPEYNVYIAAQRRCWNPNNPAYRNYGGRGIQFLFDSFKEFLDHIGARPTAKHTLDRIDNNGHYAKGNVRWVTRDVQATNMRTNRWITYEGRTHTVTQWAKITGIHAETIRCRTVKSGWCDACAISRDVKRCAHKVSASQS